MMPLDSVLYVVVGIALLVWSADRFVTGAAALARYWGMPPLLIGMLVVGFGTSSPEILVSVTTALQGTPAMALGNAYGSNITNIALILGLTAVISPIAVKSATLRQELPILTAVTVVAALQLIDGVLSRFDALVLIGLFVLLTVWSIYSSRRSPDDPLASEIEQELTHRAISRKEAWVKLLLGLVLLLISSNLLVRGAVDIAQFFGISDLVIGLTVIAIGTSLPELASSLVAAHRNEHEIAFGNVIGSNLFNTLIVVGVAGMIQPASMEPAVLNRDILIMGLLTVSLFMLGWGFRGRPGRINRAEGGVLCCVWIGYTAGLLIFSPGA